MDSFLERQTLEEAKEARNTAFTKAVEKLREELVDDGVNHVAPVACAPGQDDGRRST